ncbi:MAG: transketolase, partial [Acetobacteraceae bacterium]|nr:transketolase [Acetobacteraceae bacterium]
MTTLEAENRADVAAAKPAGDIDTLCINTIRTLAMDAVQKAKSGHPGTPMGLAPVAYTLWQNFLRYDPADANWPNRDRFVLSVGHASMLVYSLIHLTGIKAINEHEDRGSPALSLDDLKQFRQLSSKTPGHPEYRLTSGIETTTGPLGQGCGNSVGMAIAQKFLASRYNKPGFPIFDWRVWVLCGDGDMNEGVASEAASVAGHLRLGNLVWVYDSNQITIEGSTKLAFTEDVAERFRAYQWHVMDVPDVNDTASVARAFETARGITDRPVFIRVHSTIGYGAPHKAGTREAHGEPLGDDEIRGAKRAYGWPEDAQFLVPDGVYEHFRDGFGARGKKLHDDWSAMLTRYRDQYPDLARELDMINLHELPDGWDGDIPSFPADAKGVASRDSSQKVLNAIAPHVPWLIGGAADLAPSTKSNLTFEGAGSFEADNYAGRNMHFGIREHAMGSIANGMAVTGLRSYGSGFLIFSDYMKAPIRLSAIMELPVIYIFTHDSIGVGEDGPTHEPVEQLAGLRAIPGLTVIRPADANETAEAWAFAAAHNGPTLFALTRQHLPHLDRIRAKQAAVGRGAYILAEAENDRPEVILIGTGSEVALCVKAQERLKAHGIQARVVSMPSWDLFEAQSEEYRESVLPSSMKKRVTVEAASPMGWQRWATDEGKVIGVNRYGASAPGEDVMKRFGFTAEHVAAEALRLLGRVEEAEKEFGGETAFA